jgi:hypothetical protein
MRDLLLVYLNYLFLLRGYFPDVRFHFAGYHLIINDDAVEVGTEYIPEDCCRAVHLAHQQSRLT